MLDCGQLRALLRYDSATGLFVWLVDQNKIKAGTVAGWLTEKGYIKIRIGGRDYRAHRLAWLYMTGEWPSDKVDHENTTRSDNRWENLRAATDKENSRNRRTPSTNTSGFKGVVAQGNRWRAQIEVDAKKIGLGVFDSPAEAHAAYLAAASEYYGQFARAS